MVANQYRQSLFESTVLKRRDLREAYEAGRILAELKMSEKEILDLFARIEKGVTAGGQNRTILGKGKDAVSQAMAALAKFRDKISSNTYIQGVDQVFDRATDWLAKSAVGKQAMPIIEKYRELSKQYPAGKSAITWGLIFLTGLASGGALAGPAFLAGAKLLDGLISGEKLSTATMNAMAAGGASYLAGQIPGAIDKASDAMGQAADWAKANNPFGGGTAKIDGGGGVTGATGGVSAADLADPTADIGMPTSQPEVSPSVSPDASAQNAANTKAYGTDSADTTADMNAAVAQTAEPGTTPADYGQTGGGATSGATTGYDYSSAGDFKTAFANARSELGSGQAFEWKGKLYSTNVEAEGLPNATQLKDLLAQQRQGITPDFTAGARKLGDSKQYANINNTLMETIVATTTMLAPFKVKRMSLEEMIDKPETARLWMLNEALGRKNRNKIHLTETGIHNIFKNVELYQQHVKRIIAKAAIMEDVPPPSNTPPAAGPDRTNIPNELTPNMPGGSGTPQPQKPGLFRRAANWLGKAWAGAKNIGHQFTTKLTAEKLKMNWHVKGKPTDSDAIAKFLMGEGVPANVIKDVYGQSRLPIPADIDAGGEKADITTPPPTPVTPTPVPPTPIGIPKPPTPTPTPTPTPVPSDTGATGTGTGTAAGTATSGTSVVNTNNNTATGGTANVNINLGDLVKKARQGKEATVQQGNVTIKQIRAALPALRRETLLSLKKDVDSAIAKKKTKPAKVGDKIGTPIMGAGATTATTGTMQATAPGVTASAKQTPKPSSRKKAAAESRVTRKAKNALSMFESFVANPKAIKPKADLKQLTESRLVKKSKPQPKVAKKSVIVESKTSNDILALWKKMDR